MLFSVSSCRIHRPSFEWTKIRFSCKLNGGHSSRMPSCRSEKVASIALSTSPLYSTRWSTVISFKLNDYEQKMKTRKSQSFKSFWLHIVSIHHHQIIILHKSRFMSGSFIQLGSLDERKATHRSSIRCGRVRSIQQHPYLPLCPLDHWHFELSIHATAHTRIVIHNELEFICCARKWEEKKIGLVFIFQCSLDDDGVQVHRIRLWRVTHSYAVRTSSQMRTFICM